MLPGSAWTAIWQEAAKIDSRPELPALAATRVPFGLFGALDYLAGSAQTAQGGLRALADHFAAAASEIELELDFDDPDIATLRIINAHVVASELESDEFTTAVILGRFRSTSNGRFVPRRVYLTRPSFADAGHAALFGATVVYGARRAGFDCSRMSTGLEQSMADSRLHDALLDIARKLGFSNDGKTGFQGLLDQFRIEESERLLLHGSRDLVAIALELGFSDPSAWNRRFKRPRHMSPTARQAANRRRD